MYSVLKSYGLNGLNGFAVAVEADVSGGLPAFSLVGLPDSAVRESGDRVRSAVKNLGYKWPDRHITVNLAPADIRKSGPVYDLPLLLAVLASSGQMEEPPADAAFLGELALDGSLRPVSGVLPMALAAAADGIRSLYVPAENAAEAAEAGAFGRIEEGTLTDYALALIHGVEANQAQVDERIEAASENWALSRMPIVDRSILRLAVFEMFNCDDVPVSVSINEAVELAKGFGGEDDSPRFVNGVLGRIARSMEGDGAGAVGVAGADAAAAGPVDALVGASGAAACVQVGV